MFYINDHIVDNKFIFDWREKSLCCNCKMWHPIFNIIFLINDASYSYNIKRTHDKKYIGINHYSHPYP